jgi:murein L,D-transpeptidase YcbB/YkuD
MKSKGPNLRIAAIILLTALYCAGCGRPKKGRPAESPKSAVASVEAMRSLIRQRTALFDGKGPVSCGNEVLCSSPVLPRFYEARDFVPAWMADGRPTAAMDDLVAAIREARTLGLDPAAYRLARVQSLVEDLKNGRGPNNPEGYVDLDMILTDSFLLLASHLESGVVDPETIKAKWFIKTRQADLPAVLRDALAAGAIGKSLYALTPRHPWFRSLEDALLSASEIQKRGGWGEVPPGSTLKKGMTGPRVEALRLRLIASGDMAAIEPPAEPAAPAVFDDALVAGVKRFQMRHSLEPDGSAGPETIAALDVPVERRIDQIKANLERWRWLPSDFGDRYILVNIASYMLNVIEKGVSVLSMPVIVGRDYRETPVFGAEMTYLLLNPTWTVPPKLAVEDILQKVQKDQRFLAEKKIRVFSGWTGDATEVDPATIDWSNLSAARFPYQLRQDPSPENSLGRIAFMLPNPYSVYLHDTPERWLFDRAERVLSSGCIRLADPIGLAEYLLAGEAKWDRYGIIDAIQKGVTMSVPLSRPIPVFVVYLTAWVDGWGDIHFQRDVYDRDSPLIRALAEPPPSPRPDGTDINVDKVGLRVVPHASGF